MENPLNFLKKKYATLHTAQEVVQSAERTEYRTGKKVSEKPEERIENYLNRFKEILDRPDPEKRAMGIEALKRVLHKQFIIKTENIPLDYFLDQEQRIAEQQGHGRPDPTPDWQERKIKEIQNGQERSLDAWIDYLSSPDAMYPDWAKYWAFRSMTQMGGYNKEEGKFGKRTETSSQPFPTLNIACLAKTISIIQQQVALQGLPKGNPERIKKEKELMYALNHDTEYRDLVSTENFTKLYTHALEQFSGMSWKHLENIAGQWKVYPEGSDPQELYDSLQGYPLEWCTATNIETARDQLQGGDFHVYYSQDERGMAITPRIAIRMTGDSISEIRGIEKDQNVDQFIQPVIDERLAEFGSKGEQYLKKSTDMKKLTMVTEKHRAGVPLDQHDLQFLYQIDNTISGFGYQEDPRIAEILETRDSSADAAIVFNCTPDQIATSVSEVTPETKAYIGSLEMGIFNKLPATVEHVYTKFPEGRIMQKEIALGTGPKTAQEFEQAMMAKGYQVSSWAKDMMERPTFNVSTEQKKVDLVVVSVESLGFPGGAQYSEIQKRAQELGLELAPAEVGPQLRLQYDDQSNGEWLRIGMEAITDSDGYRRIFRVGRYDGGEAWLDDSNGNPDGRWDGNYRFVFVRSRK